MKGRRWPVFFLLLIALLITFLFFIVLGLALVGATLFENVQLFLLSSEVVSALISAVIYPFFPAIITVAYYDARVRKEGFDIELAMQQLDEPDDDITEPPLIR